MIKVVFYTFLVYCAVVLTLYFFQRQFIYYPEHTLQTPQEAGALDMEEVTLETDDSVKIKAWFKPPEENEDPVLVYFHGNAGHIGNRIPIIQPFIERGLGVLLLTYRGYSGNSGSPTEEGLYRDARAALNYIKDSFPFILYGNSLGAAVAMKMAYEFPSVKALILQSPFTTLVELAQYHYPLLPISLMLQDRYDLLALADKLQVPTLVIYGEEDEITPPEFSKRLFEALRQPKRLVGVHGKRHNDFFGHKETIQFLDQFVPKK